MIHAHHHGFKLPPEQQAIRDRCFHPSGTFVEFPMEDVESSIPSRFEKIVRMYPERVAVETDNESVTYDALNRSANRLANRILTNGEGGEFPIAVILHRGIPQAVAILAVLKSRKMFLLQDPNSADKELAYTLTNAQAPLIITTKSLESRLRGLLNHKVQMIDIDVDYDGSDQNPGVHLTDESGAYIKYTSGSTAAAKGVIIPHRTILHAVMNYTNSCHFCPEDRAVGINGNTIRRQFFVHLLNGAAYCPFDLQSEGMHRLAPWMEKHQITMYRSFPGVFRLFANSLTEKEQFADLRIVRLGGEPLYRSDVELFRKNFPSDCVLINAYGSAETSAVCSYYIDRSTEIIGHRVPVGYAANGKEVSIIDTAGQEVPAGETGEIIVKSRFLSSGYWRRGSQSDRFKPSDANSNVKIYRTGDLGRLSADGCLTHFGRKDERVKIRNFRVDVSEVEARLAQNPAVKLAVVVAREDDSGDLRLVAYYVARNQPAPTVTVLREFLGATLPPYMVPALFVELPEMPITSTGKVNRRALPDPAKTRPHLDTLYVEAGTPIEITLSRIWSDVLRLASVGIHDDFLELGGHSLAATRIISQVIKEFQLELPVKTLFQSPTIAAMAAIIAEHQGKKLGETEFDRILRQLESLSDEEAERLLASTSGADNTGH